MRKAGYIMDTGKQMIELEVLDINGYREVINKMLKKSNDSEVLRYLCVLIHDFLDVDY